jgi:lipopolysaccharide export system permease protein
MNRIDRIILARIAARIGLTVTVFFGLILLVESIDSWRYRYLSEVGGLGLALTGMVAAAAEWLLRGLPLLVLVGTVVAVVDLQARRELTVIKASGASIWRVLRAPAIALLLLGFGITFFGESVVTATNRQMEASLPGDSSALAPTQGFWLEQRAGATRYIIEAQHVVASGTELQDVAIFMPDGRTQGRILAPSARLVDGAWLLPTATRYRAGEPAEQLADFRVPTATTPEDLRLKLTSTEDMTFYDLADALAGRITDPLLHRAVLTRFLRLLALPVLLVGALFIAFAFTAGYRKTNAYGRAIVYAILTGFVVFVITEMADRAGSAGALDPTIAACGPALVAIVIGLTVLLYREDGWA